MNVVQPIRDPEKVTAIEDYLAEHNQRDWMLFVAGINTGLRISDLLQLRASDVRGSHLLLREKKTRKRKWIRITPTLRRAFDTFAGELEDHIFLFRSRQGGSNRPISRSRAYEILRSAAKRHGLDSIGTHSLRKTFGWHFYRQTRDVALLQELFGHSDPAITLRYIGVNQDVMDQAMQRFVIGS